MAQKNLSVPSEDIIELYDVVDGVGESRAGVPGETEPVAQAAANAPAAAPDAIGYCYENIDDFLEVLETKPSCTLMPPREAVLPAETTVAGEAPAAEPEVALIREFEAALAGAVHAELPTEPLAEPLMESPAEPLPNPLPESLAEPVAPADAGHAGIPDTPEAEEAPKMPVATDDQDSLSGAPLLDAAVSLNDGAPVAALVLLDTTPEVEANDASAEEAPLPDALEERFIRLEEALNSLNERVATLERHVADAAADFPERALHLETMLAEGRALCLRLQTLAEGMSRACQLTSRDPKRVEPQEFGPEVFPQVAEDGPDMLGLTVESLQERVSVLENRPQTSCLQDVSAIAQDVLALVRVDMKAAAEENELLVRTLETLQQRVQTLEARPLPAEDPVTLSDLEALHQRVQELEAQAPSAEVSAALTQELEVLKERVTELEERPLPELILPDLPDTEAVTTEVLHRVRSELDRVASETAARVLREEIITLMKDEE